MESSFKLVFICLVSVSCVESATLKINDRCVDTKSKKEGVCTLLKDCGTAQSQVELGDLPFTCAFSSDNHPIVCCIQDDRTDSLFNFNLFNSRRKNISDEKCLEYSEKTKNMLPRLDFIPNIVNGMNATLGEYPHMVSLGYEGDEDNQIGWYCGGTLISENFVLTAAHCLSRGKNEVKYVRVGTVDLTKNTGGKIYNVLFFIAHPNFIPPSTYNDIALIELDDTVEFTENIKPACLYSSMDLSPYKTNSMHATGFGLTSFGGNASNVLQYIILDLFTKEDCDKNYMKTRRLPEGIDYKIQLCAGKKNAIFDTCSGDSGGPLQINDFKKRLYSVVGITSFGKNCGGEGIPGVYVRVAPYVEWIESIVWP